MADIYQWGEIIKLLKHLKIDGVEIARDYPDALVMLKDGRHPGIVGQALLANLFMFVAKAELDSGLGPCSRREMLELAGETLRQAPAAGVPPDPPSASLPETPAHSRLPSQPTRSLPLHG